MKRRDFLKLTGGSLLVPIFPIAAAKGEIADSHTTTHSGNKMLTLDEITKESLRILDSKLRSVKKESLHVRRPVEYV